MSLMKPRKKNVLLAAEMRDEDDPEIDVVEGEDEESDVDDAPIPEPPPPGPPPAALSTAPITLSMADLQAIITSAVTAASAGNASLADAVTQGIAQSREPIPENKIGPEISYLNPLGERAHPRPGLKCEFFFGTQDAQTKALYRTYPLIAEDLSAQEQIALNTLTPVHAVVERMDGIKMKVSIVPELDAVTDEITRMTIVVPAEVMAKGSQVKNMLPGPLNIVKQITGHDFAALSGEELAWFMAEHRAKRYVSERQTVAA